MSPIPYNEKDSLVVSFQADLEAQGLVDCPQSQSDGVLEKVGIPGVGVGVRDSKEFIRVVDEDGNLVLDEVVEVEGEVEEGGEVEGRSGKMVIPPWIIVPIWIGLSGSVILFNKSLFSTFNYPYPVFLTAYHMAYATIGTRLLRFFFARFRQESVDISLHVWLRTILPLGVLFSASLILSNTAYVHLSVSFVQMLKAFIPILTLVIQLVIGTMRFNKLLAGVIGITTLGCVLAAGGEMKFSTFGFICQSGAVVVESARLVLIQILLHDHSFGPLATMQLFAPVCVVFIGACIPFMEGLAPIDNISNIGIPLLLLNGTLTFCLNVAGVFLIDSAGSLVLTLSGVFKDILLITFSVVIFASFISWQQIGGYSIALTGLILFKLTGGSPSSPGSQQLISIYHRMKTALSELK